MPNSIKIRGIEPEGFAALPAAARRQFWTLAAPIALKIKDRELAAGLDKDGHPLRPISPATRKRRRTEMRPSRKGSPDAPPLMPAFQKSRVRSLLAARAFDSHCELYWRYDPFSGASFARILNYQIEQGRDVFGLSPAGMRQLQQQARAAFAKWQASGKAASEHRGAFASAALKAGPQSRIARVIAGSAEAGAGDRARASVGAGRFGLAHLVDGQATGRATLSTARSGYLTRGEWGAYFRGEDLGGGRGASGSKTSGKPRPPKPPRKPQDVTGTKQARKATATPGTPDRAARTFEEALAEAVQSIGGDRTKLAEAIARTIEEHATDAGTGTYHGMSEPEAFRSVRFWEIDWHFAGEASADSAVVQTVRGLGFAKQRMPARLAEATKAVYFTGQSNKRDDHWRKVYKNFTASHATGGNGSVVVYGGDPIAISSLSHESGHNLATRLYGTTKPGGDYHREAVASAEPPVSEYAKNSPSEDFAEAWKLFVLEPERMAKDFPIRFKLIKRLADDPAYGG